MSSSSSSKLCVCVFPFTVSTCTHTFSTPLRIVTSTPSIPLLTLWHAINVTLYFVSRMKCAFQPVKRQEVCRLENVQWKNIHEAEGKLCNTNGNSAKPNQTLYTFSSGSVYICRHVSMAMKCCNFHMILN